MATVITNPADVVNLALVRIGYKNRIGSIYEGSAAAKAAIDIYSQTRDAVLRESIWGFAEKIAAAALTGNAAPFPWAYELVYPVDCLDIRNIFNASYQGDRNNPLPVLYTVANATAGKVIWTNAAAPTLVYTKQVTDPTLWEPLFVETLAAALGRRLAPVLASMDATKMEVEDEKSATGLAGEIVG